MFLHHLLLGRLLTDHNGAARGRVDREGGLGRRRETRLRESVPEQRVGRVVLRRRGRRAADRAAVGAASFVDGKRRGRDAIRRPVYEMEGFGYDTGLVFRHGVRGLSWIVEYGNSVEGVVGYQLFEFGAGSDIHFWWGGQGRSREHPREGNGCLRGRGCHFPVGTDVFRNLSAFVDTEETRIVVAAFPTAQSDLASSVDKGRCGHAVTTSDAQRGIHNGGTQSAGHGSIRRLGGGLRDSDANILARSGGSFRRAGYGRGARAFLQSRRGRRSGESRGRSNIRVGIHTRGYFGSSAISSLADGYTALFSFGRSETGRQGTRSHFLFHTSRQWTGVCR